LDIADEEPPPSVVEAGGAPKRPNRSSKGFVETFFVDGGAKRSADAEEED